MGGGWVWEHWVKNKCGAKALELCGWLHLFYFFEALANFPFVSRLNLCRSVVLPLPITIGCMRRFACRNFQLTTTVNTKLSYTPCYDQYGLFTINFIRTTEQNFLKMWVGKLKINIYI